ncbi:hypothetical protein DK842_07755 [Chromobacterium phragmitis]|uniref:Uncharacterized protein n=1 Tax=Chromobacterium phragmitis TaxID=2202141 RepID=A0A344UIT5_9NEIS|nr:hypothetical protein [Chromobacterium phragmitis]AXE29790.1 hypothetical protein DK842_07755 [Chromobacterium phragmitis]AXE35183.1 hypothetical protein DK843_13320 [Chromobacterium phragmitis]
MSMIQSEVRCVRAGKALQEGEGALADEQALEILQAQRAMLGQIIRKWRADAKKREANGGAAGTADAYQAMAAVSQALDMLAQACGVTPRKAPNPPPGAGVGRTADGKDKL